MIRIDTDLMVQVRNPVVNQAIEAIATASNAYRLNPSQLTRYRLVIAQERLVSICLVLGLA